MTPISGASDRGLHFLPVSHLWMPGVHGLNVYGRTIVGQTKYCDVIDL